MFVANGFPVSSGPISDATIMNSRIGMKIRTIGLRKYIRSTESGLRGRRAARAGGAGVGSAACRDCCWTLTIRS
ncbi:hypothetical protein GCM10017690_28840 [Microbacterium terregens]